MVFQYEKPRIMRAIEHNLFTGEPRQEFDEALIKRRFKLTESIALASQKNRMPSIRRQFQLPMDLGFNNSWTKTGCNAKRDSEDSAGNSWNNTAGSK